MLVKFGINLGLRHAQLFGVDFAKCVVGSFHDLTPDIVESIKQACGPAAVVPFDKKAESDAELEKLTAHDTKKK